MEPCVFCGFLIDSLEVDACAECGNKIVYIIDSSKENKKAFEHLKNEKQRVYLKRLEEIIDDNVKDLKRLSSRLNEFLDVCQDTGLKEQTMSIIDKIDKSLLCVDTYEQLVKLIDNSILSFQSKSKKSLTREEWVKFRSVYTKKIRVFENLLNSGTIILAVYNSYFSQIENVKLKFSEVKKALENQLTNSLNLELISYYVDKVSFKTLSKSISVRISQNGSGVTWLTTRFILFQTDKILNLKFSNYWEEVKEVEINLNLEITNKKMFQLGYTYHDGDFYVILRSADRSIDRKYFVESVKGLVKL